MSYLDISEVNIPELKLVSDAQLAIFLTFFQDTEEENEFSKDLGRWPNNELDSFVAKDAGLLPLVTAAKRLLRPELDLLKEVEFAVLEETKVRFLRNLKTLQQVQELVA